MDIEGCMEARLPGRRTTINVGANACAQASIARLAAPRAIVRICARSAAGVSAPNAFGRAPCWQRVVGKR